IYEVFTRLAEIWSRAESNSSDASEEPAGASEHVSPLPVTAEVDVLPNVEAEHFENVVRRAGYAALFGAYFLPVILNLYSIWILRQLDAEPAMETHTRRLILIGAAGINAIVLGTCVAVGLLMFWASVVQR